MGEELPGGKGEITSGGMMIILRGLEHIGDGASRQDTFVRGVENV